MLSFERLAALVGVDQATALVEVAPGAILPSVADAKRYQAQQPARERTHVDDICATFRAAAVLAAKNPDGAYLASIYSALAGHARAMCK